MTEPGIGSYRQEMTSEFGAATLDNVFELWRCEGCGEVISTPAIRVLGDSPYSDLESFLRLAADYLGRMGDEERPSCAACQLPGTVVHVDIHAHVEQAGRDLVARAPAGGEPELYWWTATGGFQPAGELSKEEDGWFRLCLVVRKGSSLGGVSGIEEVFVQEAAGAYEEFPGEPMLLRLVEALVQLGRTSLAGAITETHVATHPDDPEGYGLLAEILVIVMNHGALPIEETSQEVEGLVDRALTLDPKQLRALKARAMIHRFRGDESAAREDYLAVLAIQPGQAEVHYNLGAMDLEKNPERALEHFAAGEGIDEYDPDYPLGRARALIRLGRLGEAREALSKGRELAPEHPRIPEIEAALPKPS